MRLARLATSRQEEAPELALEREEIAICVSALAEYTDVSVFILERAENGTEVPPSWFGLNQDNGEDSTKEIASIDEVGEEDEDEEGGGVTPDGGATSQARADLAPASKQPETTSATANDQAETQQLEASPAEATTDADLSGQPVEPSA